VRAADAASNAARVEVSRSSDEAFSSFNELSSASRRCSTSALSRIICCSRAMSASSCSSLRPSSVRRRSTRAASSSICALAMESRW
jgi:hypothetical protein